MTLLSLSGVQGVTTYILNKKNPLNYGRRNNKTKFSYSSFHDILFFLQMLSYEFLWFRKRKEKIKSLLLPFLGRQ